MLLHFEDQKNDGAITLAINEEITIEHPGKPESSWTVIWNRGEERRIKIDHVPFTFPENSILPLVMNQKYELDSFEGIVSWQFNREFYCIIDHDHEVSCAGLLFYNPEQVIFLQPGQEEIHKVDLLVAVFEDEYNTRDNIQGEMLRMLLKRLIIKLTRYVKDQLDNDLNDTEYDLVRKFNLLVEKNFRQYHQVQDYADLLSKAPKTISNVFSKYGSRRPVQVIHDRIILEAKRLLNFTDKSAKEIAFDLGFQEVQHFSRFFKKNTGLSPTDFKNQTNFLSIGK